VSTRNELYEIHEQVDLLADQTISLAIMTSGAEGCHGIARGVVAEDVAYLHLIYLETDLR
jgi:hypothetical protein